MTCETQEVGIRFPLTASDIEDFGSPTAGWDMTTLTLSLGL
jgi:hypothetical protein